MKATMPSRWYPRLTPAERAKLWVLAVERGDDEDATSLLDSCPRVVGSICDPEFVAAAVAARPDRVGELMDLRPHETAPFTITTCRLQNTAEENALVEAFRSGKTQEGIA